MICDEVCIFQFFIWYVVHQKLYLLKVDVHWLLWEVRGHAFLVDWYFIRLQLMWKMLNRLLFRLSIDFLLINLLNIKAV